MLAKLVGVLLFAMPVLARQQTGGLSETANHDLKLELEKAAEGQKGGTNLSTAQSNMNGAKISSEQNVTISPDPGLETDQLRITTDALKDSNKVLKQSDLEGEGSEKGRRRISDKFLLRFSGKKCQQI